MYQLHVILNEKEYRHFMAQLQASGLSRSAFIRNLITGTDIRPRPPDEYTALLRELSAIGNNINQLARIANSDKRISTDMLEEIIQMQTAIWQRVKGM